MLILGIETSCDETSCALVVDGKEVLSNIVYSQISDHAKYGGIVPELASRKHLEVINCVIDEAFKEGGVSYRELDGVGVVNKPGLIGSLLVGLQTAKAISYELSCPLIGVNHLEAHLYAPHLENEIKFPNLGVVISGGHTLLYYSKSYTEHEILCSTVDDAIGEVFDKIAKHYELGYPGGPIIDKLSKTGDSNRYKFPKPVFKGTKGGYKISYSGLKSAVIHQREKFINAKEELEGYGDVGYKIEDVVSSFQRVSFEILLDVIRKVQKEYKLEEVVITGGVASNSYLREVVKEELNGSRVIFPSIKYATDNGAMVGGLAYHIYNSVSYRANEDIEAFPKVINRGSDGW